MADPACPDCPPTDDLDRLIHGRLPSGRSSAVTEHVGRCTGCQHKLDELAGADDPAITGFIGPADRPPADSAYWKALAAAEAEVATTAAFRPDADTDDGPPGELKLDFLRPSDTPGALGRLGPFDISRVLGRGGMGVVLRGHDPYLHRDVAIKVLDPQLANNATARQRFCREARAAAAVTHDNLVAVHQVDEDEASGLPYMIMQLVVGESLDQRLRRVGKLAPLEVARIGMQAAAGLAAAHATGLIHRDIKPANILLEDGTDRVKLTDFGLARAAEDVRLTRTGFVAGTPLYMAPEQASGTAVDHRGDLFSLGSVLYEAAAGQPPFDGTTPLAVLRRVTDETQPPLAKVNPDAPRWLSDVIDRLLAKDPADRFQTAAEVAEVLAGELARSHGLSPLDVPAEVCAAARSASMSAVRARRAAIRCKVLRAAPWVGGALVGALATGLLAVALWPPEPPAPRDGEPPHDPQPLAGIPPAPSLGPDPLVTLEARSGPVWALAFTPDGKTLVTGAEDGSIRFWGWRENVTRRELDPLGGNVWGLDVSADGRFLVAAGDDSAVFVYDLEDPKRPLYELPHPNSTKAAVFGPEGRRLATGDRNATVRVWTIPPNRPEELTGHKGTVHGLAFAPDGKSVASAGSDGTVKVWELEPGKKGREFTLRGHDGPVYAVAFNPDAAKPLLASAGWDGLVRVWDGHTGEKLHVLKGHDGDVWSLSFGGGGKLLASAGSDGSVRLWDVTTGREVQTFRRTGRGFHSVRFDREGKFLAAGSRDGNVRVWEITK